MESPVSFPLDGTSSVPMKKETNQMRTVQKIQTLGQNIATGRSMNPDIEWILANRHPKTFFDLRANKALLDATCIYFDNILDRYAQRFSI
jgi:hypothetical protein